MSPHVVQDVCHSPNLPPAGTQSQRAISSDPTSTRMTLRRPKNAVEARSPTLAKTNLLDCTHLPLNPTAFPLSARNSGRMQAYSEGISAPIGEFSPFPSSQARQNSRMYSYTSCNISSFLRMHIDAWLLFSFCLIPSLVAGYPFGGDWYRNLGDSGARASSIARPIQPGRACCARARLQATLPLDMKRSIPHLQPTYPLAFKRLIASPSAHTIPHHPDQMTLQSSCGDYLTDDMRVVGHPATSPTSFRPYRHPSDRTDHTRDDSDDGCDDSDSGCNDARYTADAANARDPTDAADARDPTNAAANARDPTDAAADACCLANAAADARDPTDAANDARDPTKLTASCDARGLVDDATISGEGTGKGEQTKGEE
ncbi:hypothetical protein EV121DRAFT_297687 [Schizophyllum commune]